MGKIKGNALFMVIVVAMIIGIFCSALISLSFVYKVQAQREYRSQRLELNSISGVDLVLAESDVLSYDKDRRIDLYGSGHDSIRVRKMRWGLFDIGLSEAFGGGSVSTKIFQMGSKPAGVSQAAIYLVDDGNSLAVSGKTVINGTCFLPARGARSTEISGYYFSGNKYVNGTIKRSTQDLPSIQHEPIDSIFSLFEHTPVGGQFSPIDTEPGVDSVFRSFSSTPLLIYDRAPLTLEKHYRGQIIFKSDTLIIVEKAAGLEDVILIAPDIIIKRGFKGSLQAFATDTLAVEEDCVLQYPSVLGIFKKDFSDDQPTVMIGKGAVVSGFVFSNRRVEDLRKTLISLQPTAKVIGYIYADGFLELKGDVLGGIMCNRFILHTASSLYENCLLNVTIDNINSSPYDLMPSVIETERKKGIAKWLW